MPLNKRNGNLRRFTKIKSINRNANSLFIGKAMTKLKPLGNLLISLKELVPPLELTGLTSIAQLFLSTSLGPITNVDQLDNLGTQVPPSITRTWLWLILDTHPRLCLLWNRNLFHSFFPRQMWARNLTEIIYLSLPQMVENMRIRIVRKRWT